MCSWTYVWLEMGVHRMSDRYKGNHSWLLYGIKQSHSSGLRLSTQMDLTPSSNPSYPSDPPTHTHLLLAVNQVTLSFLNPGLLISDTRDLKHYFVSYGGFRTRKYAVCGRNELLSLISTKIPPLWIRRAIGYFIHKRNNLSYRSALEMVGVIVNCPTISPPSLEILY